VKSSGTLALTAARQVRRRGGIAGSHRTTCTTCAASSVHGLSIPCNWYQERTRSNMVVSSEIWGCV